MAANRQSTRGLANLGKRLIGGIRSRDSAAIPAISLRSVQTSAYDKNPEDNINPTIVPDHVMPPQADEYWAPHPKTGVFGPARDDGRVQAGTRVCKRAMDRCLNRKRSSARWKTWTSHQFNLELHKELLGYPAPHL